MKLATIGAALGLLLGATWLAGASRPAAAAPAPFPGYWLVGSDGGVFSFNAPYEGSGAAQGSTACADGCTAVAASPAGPGYWLADATKVPATGYGQAALAPTSCTSLNGASGRWVGVASSLTGHGFWEVASNGGVIGCGDIAPPYGGLSSTHLTAPIVGMAPTPDRKGYWLVAADGGVFSFGDAAFYGSMGGVHLTQPVTGIAATADGHGYWLVAADGGIFSFGDATYQGGEGGKPLAAPMVGIAANPAGPGYWTVASDGGVFSFGGAPYEGSLGGQHLDAPIVGMAATANAG